MSWSIFPLHHTRNTWVGYTCVLAVLSAAYFGGLKDHLLDTHDDQTFRDNIALSEDFT